MADNPAPSKHRNSKVGQVVSRSGDKTIVVEVTRRVQHPLYKRFVSKSKKFYAHDEKNQCLKGDRVRIIETRPLSAMKRWRLDEIVHRSALLVQETKEEAAS
jgi:small subunit ribosomal protein S17